MSRPPRWCRGCHKPMRPYAGKTVLGMCYSCQRMAAKKLTRRPELGPLTEAEVEARFQASMAELKRSRRLRLEITWQSSLTRVVRG